MLFFLYIIWRINTAHWRSILFAAQRLFGCGTFLLGHAIRRHHIPVFSQRLLDCQASRFSRDHRRMLFYTEHIFHGILRHSCGYVRHFPHPTRSVTLQSRVLVWLCCAKTDDHELIACSVTCRRLQLSHPRVHPRKVSWWRGRERGIWWLQLMVRQGLSHAFGRLELACGGGAFRDHRSMHTCSLTGCPSIWSTAPYVFLSPSAPSSPCNC